MKKYRFFYSSVLKAQQRIGPHSENIISTLVGNLLGESWGEKRKNSTRFHIHMSTRNMEYFYWLHCYYAKHGYCSPEKPKTMKQIGKNGKISFSLKMRTWSFSSLNWLYDMFYVANDSLGKINKIIPKNIEEFLTPQALAIWFMDDGGSCDAGIKISTDNFSREDLLFLQGVLYKKYQLKTTLHRHSIYWILYFPKKQAVNFYNIVKPFLLPCMLYKFRNCEL